MYDTCNCPVTSANELECSDDELGCGNGLQSIVEAPVIAGNCYKIRVGGFGAAQGEGQMSLSFRPLCIGDIAPAGGDDEVNINDLLLVIDNWGSTRPGNPADVDLSGVVNVNDLLLVIGEWGPCGV